MNFSLNDCVVSLAANYIQSFICSYTQNIYRNCMWPGYLTSSLLIPLEIINKPTLNLSCSLYCMNIWLDQKFKFETSVFWNWNWALGWTDSRCIDVYSIVSGCYWNEIWWNSLFEMCINKRGKIAPAKVQRFWTLWRPETFQLLYKLFSCWSIATASHFHNDQFILIISLWSQATLNLWTHHAQSLFLLNVHTQ